MTEWQPIKTAPVGPLVLLANAETQTVEPGYGEWFAAPMPRWVTVSPEGIGRFKATHWMPLPPPPEVTP
jgi:hypothetical protein